MLQAKFIRVGESQNQYHSNKTRAVMNVKFLVKHNRQVGSSRDFGLKRLDDVCNYIAQAVCFSYQSHDVEQQDEVQASQEEEVDEKCFC
jgi:hypothetical protein